MYNSNDMYGNNYGNYYNPYNYMNYYNMNPNYIRDYGPEPFIMNIWKLSMMRRSPGFCLWMEIMRL